MKTFNYGQCTNFGYCPRADSGEVIEVPVGGEFRCPESSCGKTLAKVRQPRGGKQGAPKSARIAVLGLASVALVGFLLWQFVIGRPSPSHYDFVVVGAADAMPRLVPMLLEAYAKSAGMRAESRRNLGGEKGTEFTFRRGMNDRLRVLVVATNSSAGMRELRSSNRNIAVTGRPARGAEVEALGDQGSVVGPQSEYVVGLDAWVVIPSRGARIDPSRGVRQAELERRLTSVDAPSSDAEPSEEKLLLGVPASDADLQALADAVHVTPSHDVLKGAARYSSIGELSKLSESAKPTIALARFSQVWKDKAAAISRDGGRPIIARLSSIVSEDYPLVRRLYFYVHPKAPSICRGFAQFCVSDSGQIIVSSAGFIGQNIQVSESEPDTQDPEYGRAVRGKRRLSVTLRFVSGSFDLDNKALIDIGRILGLENQLAQSNAVTVLGFTDDRGAASQNDVLSLKRATTVAELLRSRGARVAMVRGLGARVPLDTRDSDQARALNRRVEVWVGADSK